ncbi:hypothetical protein B0T17DRAFT_496990 [Bombardia bombarda]|uniref:DUF7924 domain-containing protein n=1 Tax=Bombardia bombarda TaxID=252184 RepID=A0AA39WI15_9PEZI|nr:hypothetical protein B0T17DRAFT_496990 [Bombardia bombarda]
MSARRVKHANVSGTGPLRRSARLQGQKPGLTKRSTQPEAEEEERISPATLSRKRQIDGSDNKHQPKRPRLTRENLAKFNRMGKKEASKASASAASESKIKLSSTKTISTTSSGFAIQAYKNGILGPLCSKSPTNIKDIHKRYIKSRGTASPTESMYKEYVNTVGRARNEATMVFEAGSQLLKKYPMEDYSRVFNHAFTSFPKNAGFNSGLSTPQPDYIEGLEMPAYSPFPVDEHVKGAVLYNNDPCSLVLPHIAGEWKGRGKDMEMARLQSAYDGAALVYARNEALKLVGKPDLPGHAEITTFTTDGTTLNLFAHYASPSEDGTLKYHQYPIKSTLLIDSHQGLKDGRRGLRNGQDHARKQSYAIRDQLMEHWKQQSEAQAYWKWDAEKGQYFHRHHDGKVIWRATLCEDSEDAEDSEDELA